LNNDVTLDANALAALAPHRHPSVFSIASQIFLKDSTRYRDETNWTALFLEDGLATIHDRIPQSERVADNFYSGGGASLFQTRVLRSVLDAAAYDPFYWEDVEWGWRARKLGYRSLFCPKSVAIHRQHATIERLYPAAEVEAVRIRNRLLFQLRNFTAVGSTERVMEEISRSPEPVAKAFLARSMAATVARGRLWNFLAPVEAREVLGVGGAG
jgi:GT2 family glycosyltransferase